MKFWRWMGAKLATAVFVLWLVATLIFVLRKFLPGSELDAILGGPGSQAPPETVERIIADYGLDRPMIVQYAYFIGRLFMGDWGNSYSLRMPVADLVGQQIGLTFQLAVVSLVVAWLLAVPITLWLSRPGSLSARVAQWLEVALAALPHFWLAAILIVVFSTQLGWLPAIHSDSLRALVLPVTTLALPMAAYMAQVIREPLEHMLTTPFTLSARARGESELGIRLRHALRHVAPPVIALSGWAFGSLISGAVVVETIFARPGLGRSLVSAVMVQDVPVITAIIMIAAAGYVVITIVTDGLQRLIDPRLARVEPSAVHLGGL